MILLTPELRGRLQRIIGRKVSPAWVVSASAIALYERVDDRLEGLSPLRAVHRF